MSEPSLKKELGLKQFTLYVICCIIFIWVTGFIFSYLSELTGLSFFNLSGKFINSLYFPHYNKFEIDELNGINALLLFDALMISIVIVCLILTIIIIYPKFSKLYGSFSRILTIIWVSFFLIFIGLQQIKRSEYFLREYSAVSGKTTKEKNLSFFRGFYGFARSCQEALQYRHKAKFITDLGISSNAAKAMHRVLSFHLYPKVSLTFRNEPSVDSLLLVFVEKPEEVIPENYQILITTQNKNLIFAIKKNSLR